MAGNIQGNQQMPYVEGMQNVSQPGGIDWKKMLMQYFLSNSQAQPAAPMQKPAVQPQEQPPAGYWDRIMNYLWDPSLRG